MSSLTCVPFHPESPNMTIYFREKPEMRIAETEWTYTEEATKRWRLSKPVPKQFRKEAPAKWVANGWIKEKGVSQLTLF